MNRSATIAALLAAGLFAAGGAAQAEKPDWAGGGKHGKQEKRNDDRRDDRYDDRRDDRRGGTGIEFRFSDNDRYDDRRDDRRGGTGIEFRFSDNDRRVLSDYYGGQARAGHCPPGLAKKNNGCMPPGQAKKWQRGYPLPGDVRYYELSRDILVHLPAPPRGHRYVQVAGDVLLIAVGTSMVVDAVEDLLR